MIYSESREKFVPGILEEHWHSIHTTEGVFWVYSEKIQTALTLTVSNTCQGLVEGGCVTVIGQGDTHAAWQQPAGECESLFIQQQPALKLLIIHLFSLHRNTQQIYYKYTVMFCSDEPVTNLKRTKQKCGNEKSDCLLVATSVHWRNASHY